MNGGYFSNNPLFNFLIKKKKMINCEVSEFGEWSECVCQNNSPTGYITREREILVDSKNGGIECPILKENSECKCPVNCIVSAFSEWSNCVCEPNKTTGISTRNRNIIVQNKNGGENCPNQSETKTCYC